MREEMAREGNLRPADEIGVDDTFDREVMFLLAAEAAFDSILIHEHGKILFVNQTLVNLLGYSSKELLGRSVLDFVEPESRAELERRIGTGSTEAYEAEGIRKNGSRFIAEIRAKAVTIEGHEFRVAAIRDITHQKEEEHALAREMAEYQKGQAVLLDLLKNIDLPEATLFARVTESAARALQVARVGIWTFEEDESGIRLSDLFESTTNSHKNQISLNARDFPGYFNSLRSRRVLDVCDALHDPRTAELADSYLKRYGIGAMLDVPIWHRGQVAGILCHEHIGGPRQWSKAEQQVASSIADIITIALEARDRRQAEQEARSREERLRLITSQMPALVWTTDRQLRVTSSIGTGLSPLNVRPRQQEPYLFELFQDRDLEHPLVRPQLEALEGKSVTYDGEWQGHFYQVHIEPFRDAQGDIIGTIGLAQDITERKRAEDQVRLLHGLSTAMSSAEDPDAALQAALEHICSETGWEVGQVWIPDRTREKLILSQAWYGPKSLCSFRKASEAVSFEHGQGQLGKVWETKAHVWNRDLSLDPNYRRADAAREAGLRSALAVPVLDGNEVVAVLDFAMVQRRLEDERMVTMVTAAAAQLGSVLRRKEIEAERVELLKKQRQLAEDAGRREVELRTIINHMVDAVFVIDRKGRLSMLNESASELFAGVGVTVRLGMPIGELGDALGLGGAGRRKPRRKDPVLRVLCGETIVEEQLEVHFNNPPRSAVFRISAGPVRDADGRIVGGVGVGRDITEFVEFARMKDSFIRVTAHELKTPLAIMKGYSQAVLRAKAEFPPAYRKMLEAIDSGSNRIVRLVNDLLDVTRTGTIEIKAEAKEIFDLAACVRETLQSQTLTSKHELRYGRVEPVRVRGDLGRIEQVVTNFLQNASKYSPPESEITIEVFRADAEAIVSVTDKGIGIPDEQQPFIFQRFFRAHADTAYDAGGMGVGLYISKEIIQKHGGRIWFKSKEGKGSTFSFALPLAEP
jgi:PAS domain S-box-containing protein